MIAYSAIMFHLPDNPYPIIMTGKRHADILEEMFKRHMPYIKETAIQGFVTDGGSFLDRYDAKIEARRCGQLVEDTDDRALYSEDIWPE